MKLNFHFQELQSIDKGTREFEFLRNQGSVFQSPDFLNAYNTKLFCASATSGDDLVGILVGLPSKRFKVKGSHIPPYAFIYGPVISGDYHENKGAIITGLLEMLPKYPIIEFKLRATDDILPFLKESAHISLSQTHIVPFNEQFDQQYIHSSKRRYLKKLLKLLDEEELIIKRGEACFEDLLWLQNKTGEKSNFEPSLSQLSRIVKTLPTEMYYAFVVYSHKGEPLSGAFCPFDTQFAYHLINASVGHSDKLLNNSNILSAYLAVKQAFELGKSFDFEGSNIPGVANFYRMMGGQPSILYRVQIANSLKAKLIIGGRLLLK